MNHTKQLPRILIIDDVLGRKGKERRNFCLRLDLLEPESKIFIDDPVAEAVFCTGQLKHKGKVTNDMEGTLKFVKDGWKEWPRWALLLLDLHFDTGEPGERDPKNYFGLKILDRLYQDKTLRDIPVVILSSMEREHIEQIFADRGVFDFIDKTDMTPETLKETLFTNGLLETPDAVGRSVTFLKCLREARQRSRVGNENILILGESGTGKEILAEYIHKQSGRRGYFNPLFTQGVPETLIEDRLFGHAKGAFDGANTDQIGAAEYANGGTLFIDEFGNIPSSIQEKLLRLLDKNTREIQKLGSQVWKALDILVVMATNKMDILEVKDFRSDLLWRVEAYDQIKVPPLRDRREDILLLAEFFIKKFEAQFKAMRRAISKEAEELLTAYAWPGNVRELQQTIEKAVYRYKGLKILSVSHLDIGKMGQNIPPGQSDSFKPLERDIHAEQSPLYKDIDTFIKALKSFEFDSRISNLEESKGKLKDIHEAYAIFIVKYLKAALEENKRRYDNKIEITPAMKWATGDMNLSTTAANRLLKNFLKISEDAVMDLLRSDPVLNKVACELKLIDKDF